MIRWNNRLRILALALGVALSPVVSAQWVERAIPLNPGWNAVFLDIQPGDTNPAAVFDGLPIERAFVWLKRSASIAAVAAPAKLGIEGPDWLTYVPEGQPGSHRTNLFAIFAGNAYLIKVAGSQPVTWVVKGQPKLTAPSWTPDKFTLTGFPLDASAPPTFANFFGASDAHAGQPAYRLSQAGLWVEVADKASETMSPHEAYWFFTRGASNFHGPLRVVLDNGFQIDYGLNANEARIIVTNDSMIARIVMIEQKGSPGPPSADFPAQLGPVPLANLERTGDQATDYSYFDLTGPIAIVLEPGRSEVITLAVRRSQMADAILPPGFDEGLYQDILEIMDDEGVLLELGVTSRGLSTPVAEGVKAGTFANPDPRAGLWVGNVELTKVTHIARAFSKRQLIALFLFDDFPDFDGDDDGVLTFGEAAARIDIPLDLFNDLDVVGDGLGLDDLQAAIGAPDDQPSPSPQVFPPVPVADNGQLLMRLILHVDYAGQARLVRHVTQMRHNGGFIEGIGVDPDTGLPMTIDIPDPADPTRIVLITDDALLDRPPAGASSESYYVGTSVQDGQSAGIRISTNSFMFTDPLPGLGEAGFHRATLNLDGQFPTVANPNAGTLMAALSLPWDHPLNPFFHKFHPDHDNRDAEGKPFGWRAVAAYEMYRTFGTHATAGLLDFAAALIATENLQQQVTRGLFNTMDFDRDENLTLGEIAPHAWRGIAAQMLFDNFGAEAGDNLLSFTEALSATAALSPVLTKDFFNQIDANLDGVLILAEIEPFKDNLRPDGDGLESFTVNRLVTMDFRDPNEPGECETCSGFLPDWGATLLFGKYEEEIFGLHKLLADPNTNPPVPGGTRGINVEGTFLLRRVSNVVELNDGLLMSEIDAF